MLVVSTVYSSKISFLLTRIAFLVVKIVSKQLPAEEGMYFWIELCADCRGLSKIFYASPCEVSLLPIAPFW